MLRKSLIFIALVAGPLLGGLAGCGTTFVMEPDASVPFAKGEVAASFEKDGNNRMTVKVEHLGDAGKLNPSATTYVVWIRPRNSSDAKWQNMCSLTPDSSYTASYTFPTTFTDFDISITPESTKDVTTPSGREILRATVSGNSTASAPPPQPAAPPPAAPPPAASPPAALPPAAASTTAPATKT